MARLRLLFALFLVAVGTTFGALAISGYYEPHMTHGQSMAAPIGAAEPTDTLDPAQSPSILRFIAIDDGPPARAPAKPKAAAKTAPTKPKPVVAAAPVVREKRPQAAAPQWPWNLISQ